MLPWCSVRNKRVRRHCGRCEKKSKGRKVRSVTHSGDLWAKNKAYMKHYKLVKNSRGQYVWKHRGRKPRKPESRGGR